MTDTVHLLKDSARQTADRMISLIYPLRCPVCDRPVRPYGEDICLPCMKRLKALKPPFCERCGKKISAPSGICTDCSRNDHIFTRCRSAFEYDTVRAAIYRFKYLGRREYAHVFAEMTHRILADYLAGIRPDAITFVPLSREKERTRGYNQARDYAGELSKLMNIPLLDDALIRVRNTAPMKLLTPQERLKNLKNAFKSGQNVVKSKSILLVDDIYTTGATMDECARVLFDAGANKVYCVTLASGKGV